MNSASINLEVDAPETVSRAVGPALEDSGSNVGADKNSIQVSVSSDSPGSLRGRADAAFRLAMLSNRIVQR